MRILNIVVLVIALSAAGCGTSGSNLTTSTADAAPVGNDSSAVDTSDLGSGSTILSRCGVGEPPAPLVADTLAQYAQVEFGEPALRAGDTAPFTVMVNSDLQTLIGDEWIVECFTGTSWVAAWMAYGVFRDTPGFTYLDDGYGADDDGWNLVDGSILIPPDTPDGIYRIAERFVLYDGSATGDPSTDISSSFETRFMVGEVDAQLIEPVVDDDDALDVDSGDFVGALQSDTLARCGLDASDDSTPTAVVIDERYGFTLTLDRQSYAPGTDINFDWTVPSGVEGTVGDEWIVECWDGTEWAMAWMAVDIYGPNPRALSLDRDIGMTDDGYVPSAGIVVVPIDAPAGVYRLFQRVFVHDAEGYGLRPTTVSVHFSVGR